ncbi:uncharacterized protein C8Q71DRAFT_164015 [Rhodofomes roseus]|uniref:Uncharacterized protein n=1 Tax=Rhodofomes roseus TaxID=34475 RepID=A0ABQ8K9Y4_9APHY|nr:uncharacterized protein C8Q71DRAFT_164015 [Rhodofomes roseus]KAH9834160.1 hypothetical protein C8Q71DRAFT_164015 [Rhodofomes roseus]
MFATYYPHSMQPVGTPLADATFSNYATSGEVQSQRLTIKVPSKQNLVEARPKIGLRKSAFRPSPEQGMGDGPVPARSVELESPPPAPKTVSAPVSPTRVYGRPRRPGASPRHSRPSDVASPSGASEFPAARPVEVFQSITCMPQCFAASFEELRLECYRVSYVTTGHAPMPVTSESAPWDTIPPFFSPFSEEVMEPADFVVGRTDVPMPDESTGPWAFTFGVPGTSNTPLSDDTSMEY